MWDVGAKLPRPAGCVAGADRVPLAAGTGGIVWNPRLGPGWLKEAGITEDGGSPFPGRDERAEEDDMGCNPGVNWLTEPFIR